MKSTGESQRADSSQSNKHCSDKQKPVLIKNDCKVDEVDNTSIHVSDNNHKGNKNDESDVEDEDQQENMIFKIERMDKHESLRHYFFTRFNHTHPLEARNEPSFTKNKVTIGEAMNITKAWLDLQQGVVRIGKS